MKTFLLFTLLSISISSVAQSEEAMYSWFDAQVSSRNTGLYSGKEYIDFDRATQNNHKFFITPKFTEGKISYHNQPYYDVKIKYDVYNDLLVINLPKNKSEVILQPIKQYVNGFTYLGHEFININQVNGNKDITLGFYEVLTSQNGISLLKKYTMAKSTKLDEKNSYNKYTKSTSSYVVQANNRFEKIKSKRDISILFPEYKSEIQKINKLKDKKDESKIDAYYISIIERITALKR